MMKTIGLIGGMSWESTVTYYQVINETIKQQLGGLHSAKCILYSVDFDEIEKYQSSGEWNKSAYVLTEAARRRFHRDLHEYHAQSCTRNQQKDKHTYLTYCRYDSH